MTLSTLVPLCVVCASRGSQREVVKIKQAKRYFRITNHSSELTQQDGRGKKTRQTSCDKRDNNFV